jgi:hypothetical protein
VRHQQVVHVAAVVDDEDDARLARHGGERRLVEPADAHAVEHARQRARHPVAEAEVEVGVEGGHDLARVALDLRHRHLARHPLLLREGLRRLHHLRVVDQAVDEHAPR